ncbi:MAG: GNAT family N-acetyltransferase [Gemmatimonadota bacterium]
MDDVLAWHRDEYTVSTDRSRLDLAVIHGYLARSYWAAGIPRAIVARSIDHSLPYGLYHRDQQVGFARVVTDHAVFGYVADVFVLEGHRSRGLARWMMRCILETPDLQGFRRWLLLTKDAHAIYQSVGFVPVAEPARFMEMVKRNPYNAAPTG